MQILMSGGLGRLSAAASVPLEGWRRRSPHRAPAPASWPRDLRRLQRAGWLLLAVELGVFLRWNQTQVHDFSLTADFASYLQAIHLLLHGSLSLRGTAGFMYGTDGQPRSFWHTVAELDIVPLAIAFWVWPHIVLIKWLQSLALVGAQAVAFRWMCELAADARGTQAAGTSRLTLYLPVAGLLVMVLDPWFIWASSFDFHAEPIVTCLAAGTARDLYFGRKRAWFWAVAGILCSAVGATYVATVAVGAILSGRGRAKLGLALAGTAVAWFALVAALHLVAVGGPLAYASILNGGATDINNVVAGTPAAHGVTYARVLSAALHHPLNVLRALWGNHANIWAPVSAAGIIGVFWPPALIPALVVLLEGGFARGFSEPGYQSIVIAPLLATGTVAVLLALQRRTPLGRQTRVVILAGIVLVNSVTWARIWFPLLSGQWASVPAASSRALAADLLRIRAGDEVVVSQGVGGAFADRTWVYTLTDYPTTIVRADTHVWFVLTPYAGPEVWTSAETFDAINQLEHTAGARLVDARADTWLFEWTPLPAVRTFTLGSHSAPAIPASASVGSAGLAAGRLKLAYVASSGRAGFVTEALYADTPVGEYRASVELSAKSPATIQVWDYTRSQLLADAEVPRTRGVERISLTFRVRQTIGAHSLGAVSPWGIEPIIPSGDQLLIRVKVGADKSGAVRVYSSLLSPIG